MLDLEPVKERLAAELESEQAAAIWFGRLLHLSLIATVTDRYQPFSRLADAALELTAAALNRSLPALQRKEILGLMWRLPAWPDVAPALNRLRHGGFRLAALTNSSREVLEAQIETAGLARFFSHLLSVDAVRLFKPHRAVYDFAASRLGCRPEELLLVAAHPWDVSGAILAGWRAAFIARPRQALTALDQKPTLECGDFAELADKLLG